MKHARIYTRDDPEICVFKRTVRVPVVGKIRLEIIARYPLTGEPFADILERNGWRLLGEMEDLGDGFLVKVVRRRRIAPR